MISRQLSINSYVNSNRKKRGGELTFVFGELAECLPTQSNVADETEMLAMRDLLDRFLSSLSEQTRKVFVRRYWYASSIAEIAKEYGMKKSAVGMSLIRTREMLKEYLKKEGFDYDC